MPSVVSTAQLRTIARGIDGIVGQDFLLAFNYTLDYRRKRLRWSAETRDEQQPPLTLVRQGNRVLVRVAGEGRNDSVALVPDSGSDSFVIFERNGRTPLAVDYTGGFAELSAVAGRQIARPAVVRSLRLGDVTLRDQPVVVLTRDDADASEGDGLLPFHRFSSVSFNNSERYLVVRR